MTKKVKFKGKDISTGEADMHKGMHDGVTVETALCDDRTPTGVHLSFSLHLTFNWPQSLPDGKVDFVLVALNRGNPFLCAFRFNTFGLDMLYSEHSHSSLVKALSNTKSVTIKEISDQGQREYECELKHCND